MMNVSRAVLLRLAVALSAGALSASAITQEEWEADPSLIPTPTASSVFYVVEPTAMTGEQTVSADVTGLDVTPTERDYYFPFDTELTSHKPGIMVIVF